MAGKLNDNEVTQEMNKMIAFIKQEALEKAREVKVKADEEFNIEKAKIVRQETLAIEAIYQKKKKQADVQRKIAQSNHINQCRLKVLQARQQVLNEIFADAKTAVAKMHESGDVYGKIIQKLIIQGAFQLMERDILIKCRKVDVDLAKSCIGATQEAFKKEFKLDLNVSVNEDEFLSEKSAGGVIVSTLKNTIFVNNTLESRLDLLSDHMLPDIRIMLFGPSASRKFFN